MMRARVDRDKEKQTVKNSLDNESFYSEVVNESASPVASLHMYNSIHFVYIQFNVNCCDVDDDEHSA